MDATGIIIQARTTSERLPKKVLMALPYGDDTTVLSQVIRRVKAVQKFDHIIVATTPEECDKPIAQVAQAEQVERFCGDRDNVLKRFYDCACHYQLKTIIRVTSDCPCIDPTIISNTLSRHLSDGADYTSTSISPSFPRGYDVEVITFSALHAAFKEATTTFDKEHVTPFLYTQPDRFTCSDMTATPDRYAPEFRVTLDTIEDYLMLCGIFDELYDDNPLFGIDAVLSLLRKKPWLAMINQKVRQKQQFESIAEEVAEACHILTQQELHNACEILRSSRK